MSNVMEMRNIRNKPSRSGFDLSENTLFTAKAGELLPFFCKLAIPGDHIELYPQSFTRTVPVNTAAYTSIKESINFFFVPFHLLSNRYDTFLTQMLNNPQHAASLTTSQTISAESPYFTVSDIGNLILSANGAKAKDEMGMPLSYSMCKLLSYLGYQDFRMYLTGTAPTGVVNRRLSPFPLLAYQKIYYDYYRYQQWENSSPWCFNIDWAQYGQSLNVSSLSNSDLLDSMFSLRYANFKKDYFLGVLPSPQYGDASILPIVNTSNLASNSLNVVSRGVPYPSGSGESFAGVQISGDSGSIQSLITNTFSNPSVLTIRKAEAIQKLREIQQSGNQDYKEQIEKIFGVTMSQDKSDLCEWLGGYDSSINISEVINQSLNSGDDADIKGKGIGNGSGKITKDINDFGFVIGIYTAIPKLYYDFESGSPESRMVHSDHYPNPVLDKVGMESMSINDVLGDISTGIFINSQFGYAPRYYQFKTSCDRVKGGFSAPRSGNSAFASWVSPLGQAEFISKLFLSQGNYKANYKMFKVSPAILNPIFNTQITTEAPAIPFSDDQFLINMSVGAAFVRNLDYDGLPY